MSAATFTAFDNVTATGEEPSFFTNLKHATTGLKITSIVIGLLNFSIATAIAWSCSNLMIAIVAFVVSMLVGALIGLALIAFLTVSCTDAVVALGAKYGTFVAWLSAKFSRA